MQEIIERKHPIYWFDDGSVVIEVEVYQFKVHHTLVSRHSRFLSAFDATGSSLDAHNLLPQQSDLSTMKYIPLHAHMRIRARDVEALMQHLYHDVPLDKNSTFNHLASLIRVSSPSQLDYPLLHDSAKEILETRFPTDPTIFTHDHPLHEALPLATEFKMITARKAILYSLVSTTDFDVSGNVENEELHRSDEKPREGEYAADPLNPASEGFILSAADAKVCTQLMTRIIEHFSPILFTAPAASHMNCTDVFAGNWMRLVIQPAIDNDGVYKPLETLSLIKKIDWEGHGLCSACAIEKEKEWTEEQKTIWALIDEWTIQM